MQQIVWTSVQFIYKSKQHYKDMADKDTGLIGGDTGNIKQTESNRVLTYAAVSDMIAVNNTVVVYKGTVNREAISISKVSGTFLSDKTINALQSYAIAQFTNEPDSLYDKGGAVFTGILYAINNGAPLVGSVFDVYNLEQGIPAYVYARPANNYTMWTLVWCNILGNTITDGCEVIFQLHLKYN